MKSTDREIEVVYTQHELESKIEEMKSWGYNSDEIKVLANDSDILNSVETQTGVQTKETETLGSKFKSFFTGEDAARAELSKLNLNYAEVDEYQKALDNGGIILYTDHRTDNRTGDQFKRNTAYAPFGRDVERDGNKFNDPKIVDRDVKADINQSKKDSGEIYTTEVRREDQHGEPGYADKTQDSRLKGESIHPTGDSKKDESSLKEKRMDHEPNLETDEGDRNLNREEEVNKKQNEPLSGKDEKNRREFEETRSHPHEQKNIRDEIDKKMDTQSTPRLF